MVKRRESLEIGGGGENAGLNKSGTEEERVCMRLGGHIEQINKTWRKWNTKQPDDS